MRATVSPLAAELPLHHPKGRSTALPVLGILLGLVIFAVDTLTPLDTAVAVLYVAVVMLLADKLSPRGIVLAGVTCVGLTLVSFFIMHGGKDDLQAIMRAAVSVTAILAVTLLSLRNRHSNGSLRSQAALLNLTHDAILVRDPDDTIIYWNSGAEELYGWTAAEALGRQTAELLKTVFPQSQEVANHHVLETSRWEGELRHTRKDGTLLTVSSRWSQQHDDQGRPVATMETNNDITRRKRTEDDLHKAHTELAHVTRVATLGQLTASIAHEINQPLAAVVTNGEACLRWLRRPQPDVAEAVASVERMIANGRRASDVVARLRALARRDDPHHLPLDLREVVDDSLALLAREISHRKVALSLTFPTDLPQISGDRVQLQQVVMNVLINALQAMDGRPKGRHLSISAKTRDSASGPMVALDVSDDGSGIAPADLPHIFEAFYTSKPDGMGLGLSICQSIIEAHDGRIEALPNPDIGMTFRISLPANRELPS